MEWKNYWTFEQTKTFSTVKIDTTFIATTVKNVYKIYIDKSLIILNINKLIIILFSFTTVIIHKPVVFGSVTCKVVKNTQNKKKYRLKCFASLKIIH